MITEIARVAATKWPSSKATYGRAPTQKTSLLINKTKKSAAYTRTPKITIPTSQRQRTISVAQPKTVTSLPKCSPDPTLVTPKPPRAHGLQNCSAATAQTNPTRLTKKTAGSTWTLQKTKKPNISFSPARYTQISPSETTIAISENPPT